MWNCLLQATKDKMKTIAFPAIGTGNLMYPIESVAEAMMSTVEKFRDEQSTTLISVFFVIFDTGTLQVYHIIRNVEKEKKWSWCKKWIKKYFGTWQNNRIDCKACHDQIEIAFLIKPKMWHNSQYIIIKMSLLGHLSYSRKQLPSPFVRCCV